MENIVIKYVSVGNAFSLESKTLKRRKALFFSRNISVAAQSDSFNLALLQGACSQETPFGFVG